VADATPPDPSEKSVLRTRVRASLSRSKGDDLLDVGRRAATWLVADPRFVRATRVGLFASLSDEPSSRPLFDVARAAGTPVLWPRCIEGDRLEFARADAWNELRPGRYGVLEPTGAADDEPFGELDLVIVPGVAFDRKGGRLGRGRGFYDRTFAHLGRRKDHVGPHLLGFACEIQMVDHVPMESHDLPIDGVLTEAGLRWWPSRE